MISYSIQYLQCEVVSKGVSSVCAAVQSRPVDSWSCSCYLKRVTGNFPIFLVVCSWYRADCFFMQVWTNIYFLYFLSTRSGRTPTMLIAFANNILMHSSAKILPLFTFQAVFYLGNHTLIWVSLAISLCSSVKCIIIISTWVLSKPHPTLIIVLFTYLPLGNIPVQQTNEENLRCLAPGQFHVGCGRGFHFKASMSTHFLKTWTVFL